MFLLDCRGSCDRFSYVKSSLLSLENINSYGVSYNDHNKVYEEIILFKNEFSKSSILGSEIEEVFSFAKKYFQILDRAGRNNNVPITDNDYSNYRFLRENIIHLFIVIRDLLNDIILVNGDLTIINKYLYSFRLMLKTLDTLPDFVIQNCTSDLSNQCTLASFHIFHIYLELMWIFFVITLKVLSTKVNSQDQFLDTQTEEYNTEVFSVDSNLTFNSEIEKEIEWLLYNLISLANKSYERAGAKAILACSCVKEMWLGTQILIENLSKEGLCSDFWFYYNNIIVKYIFESNTPSNYSCNMLYKMKSIKSMKQNEFCLHLLLRISRLQLFDSDGQKNISSQRITSNYSLLEIIIKNITSTEQTISETNMREVMKQTIQLISMWSELKQEVLTLLWEYFHKRLNSAFSVSGKDESPVLFQNSSILEIITSLKSHLNIMDNNVKRDTKPENSFSLFSTLLGLYLKKSIISNQINLSQKIKGRIIPKFTLNKINALNEFGLKNFSTLFLVMAISTDIKDICNKLQELLLQLPIDSMPWNKRQIVMKVHLIILYLYIENDYSISKPALSVKNLVTTYCGSRDQESMNFVKMVLNDCLDIMDISSGFQNDEYILFDVWIIKYLTVCNYSDIYNVLESFISILSKLHILCSYPTSLSESVSSMVNVFFTHILSCVKSLYSNGTSALQVADLAFNFGKFVLENNYYAEKYESFESILKYFINIQNANERVMRHYLTTILQDDHILQSLESENHACQTMIIHSWIKCALLSKECSPEDDTHLMLLITQLKEFSALNIIPHYGGSEQINLCKFFIALKNTWNNIIDINEMTNFKKRVNVYLKDIDKYVLSIIKSPSTVEHITQIFIIIGTLFLHCSPIIYTRADPSCLLHTLISSIILPPQLFMEKKIHPYVTTGICRSWYIFMKGLYTLDYKNDNYIEKAMRDMIIQYLPFFTEKTLPMKDTFFSVSYRMISDECSNDLLLEKYILEKIAINFITCRGKQSHIHSTKALCIILHHCSTSNIILLNAIVTCTFLSIFEQLMFSDIGSANKKISNQIINTVCNNVHNNDNDIKNEVREILIKTCQKHLAFNSIAFFKLVLNISPILGYDHMNIFLSTLKMEIVKVEKMRGVGYDQGLRNGINEIELNIASLKISS